MESEDYAAEVVAARQESPNTRFIAYDYGIVGDRAWFCFTLEWTDLNTGQMRTWANMPAYGRIGSKAANFAETWLLVQQLGSAWPDEAAQEHWVSKRS